MLLNNICNDVTQTSVTNMLQQQHVTVAPATTTLLQHPVTCTLSIHRVVQNGALAMPAWFKDLAELYCSGRHHWSGRSFAEEACGAVARATLEVGDIDGLASAFAELQRPFTRAEGDEAHPHDDRSAVDDATKATDTMRRCTPGTPPRSPRRALRAGPQVLRSGSCPSIEWNLPTEQKQITKKYPQQDASPFAISLHIGNSFFFNRTTILS